jgi:hypothetical protein
MFHVENTGQIRLTQPLGQWISKYAADPRFSRYLEIGTWNGRGSTCCFYDGFSKRSDPHLLQSLETDRARFKEARGLWKQIESIHILHGRVLPDNKCPTFEEVQRVHSNIQKGWHTEDVRNFWSCPHIPMFDPHVILLDGAEYLTWFEFLFMIETSTASVYILDDTMSSKCPKIVEWFSQHPEWKCIASGTDRNGWAIYETDLVLGESGRQGYGGILHHLEDAFVEAGRDPTGLSASPDYALFSKAYVQSLRSLNLPKIHDYVFIGSISSSPENRQWVIEFAKKHFTENSVFVNTDMGDWTPIGIYDKTFEVESWSPKKEDWYGTNSRTSQYRTLESSRYYFETMASSAFALCPAGDAPWSFRWYEILMCGSIPIVETYHHTYRTVKESLIPFNYLLKDDVPHVYNQSIVDENNLLFDKYHMLH